MLIQVLMNGLVAGSIYVLMALGFSLIFGIMRLVNFSHGAFYMWGAFVLYLLQTRYGVNYFVALLLSALIVGAAGVVCELLVFRLLQDLELPSFIVSVGLSIVLYSTAALVWGGENRRVAGPVGGVLHLGALSLPVDRLFAFLAAGLLVLLFNWFIMKSRLGKAMRAVTEDGEIAAIQGIRIGYMRSLAFFLAVVLAALAGGLLAPIFSVYPYMGDFPLMKAFIVVILGGLGSVGGAVVAGLCIGLLDSFAGQYLGGSIGSQLSFMLVALVLVIKPSGLFGRIVSDR